MNYLEELEKMKAVLEQLDYKCEVLRKSTDLPLDMLSVMIGEDGDSQQYLTIAIYPMQDGLDDSKFVQFYFQAPFEISMDNLGKVLAKIQQVNRQLPLGHFNLSAEVDKLYYKYVLTVPRDMEWKPKFLSDIMDMLSLIHI